MPATKELREKRRLGGLCLPCGAPAIAGETRCERCRALHRAAAQRSTARKLERRICIDCQKPAIPNQARCEDHRRRQTEHTLKSRKKYAHLFHTGICYHCGKEAMPAAMKARFGRCVDCYMKALAAMHLGARSQWQELKSLLEKQNYCCPYTGEKLVTGVNASIDHEKPTSRFPELRYDISNIEWVSKAANTAKGNRTKTEFIAWVAEVNAHCSRLSQGKHESGEGPR